MREASFPFPHNANDQPSQRTPTPNMPKTLLNDQGLRSRKVLTNGPPVPPKSVSAQAPSLRSPTRLTTKSLPPAPGLDKRTKTIRARPLPPLPKGFRVKTTLLWVAGFCVWFLLIVILLPIITEKDAMPGFNRWLRQLYSRALEPGKDTGT